jgi:serine protease
MHVHRRTVAAAIAACGAMLVMTTTTAQQAATAAREIVSEVGLPGIDRGLREIPTPSTDIARQALRDRVTQLSQAYLPDSFIVKFRAGTSVLAQRAMLALVDGSATAALPSADFDIVKTEPGVDPEAAAQRLAALPDIDYAQARYIVRPQMVPNDPFYSRQWHFPAIDMERAWDINPGATPSIVVAVLDTGVAYRSANVRFSTANAVAQLVFPGVQSIDVPFAAAPELGPATRFASPRDFVWGDLTPFDLEGHGTHVAGTIGQLTNNNVGVAGMAYNVTIMPVKVIGGAWDIILANAGGTDDSVAQGIRYAVDNGAKVLNMSIGRTGPPAPVIQDALSYAVSRGAFVAIAAGNDFGVGNPIERPADLGPMFEGVVSVAATGRQRQHAPYSSSGSYVEIAAPGGDQVTDGGTGGVLQQSFDPDLVFPALGPPRFDSFVYIYEQGTSMATAHVSGFAALLMQQGITSPAAIEAAMKRFATDLGPVGRDDQFGSGQINVRATLRGMGLAR